MKPGIHISSPADEWDGKDDGDDRSPAEMAAELRDETAKHKTRRDADARKPKSFAEIDTAAVYAKFNRRDGGKTLADADND